MRNGVWPTAESLIKSDKLSRCIQGLSTIQRGRERHSTRHEARGRVFSKSCSWKNQTSVTLMAGRSPWAEWINTSFSHNFKDSQYRRTFCLQWPFSKGTLNNVTLNSKHCDFRGRIRSAASYRNICQFSTIVGCFVPRWLRSACERSSLMLQFISVCHILSWFLRQFPSLCWCNLALVFKSVTPTFFLDV